MEPPPSLTIIRRSEPHKYDHAKRGTRCIIYTRSIISAVYEQMSDDEENPRWELIETPRT